MPTIYDVIWHQPGSFKRCPSRNSPSTSPFMHYLAHSRQSSTSMDFATQPTVHEPRLSRFSQAPGPWLVTQSDMRTPYAPGSPCRLRKASKQPLA